MASLNTHTDDMSNDNFMVNINTTVNTNNNDNADTKHKCNDPTATSAPKQQRRMSFNSAAVAMGAFPQSVNFDDAIINAIFSFPSSNSNHCLTPEELYPLVDSLMEVDRMRGIPSKKKRKGSRSCKGKGGWWFEPLDRRVEPKEMIRVVDIHCDTLDELSLALNDLNHYNADCDSDPKSTANVTKNDDTNESNTKARSKVKVNETNPTSLRSSERNLPWWEFCLLRNKGQSESMLVFRLDHAIGDGFSVARLCSKFITREDGSYISNLIPERMMTSKQKNKGKVGKTAGMLFGLIPALFTVMTQATTRFDHNIHVSKNVLRQKEDTRHRKVYIFDPIPLAYIKAIQKKASASADQNETGKDSDANKNKVTFNDVLVTALSQSIHDFCKNQECEGLNKRGKGVRCRATMTFGFPSDESVDINDAIHNGW